MGEGAARRRVAVWEANTVTIADRFRDGFWRTLSPFQRTLISTDGTVTRTLEAFTGEAIKCVKLDQAFGSLEAQPEEADALEAPRGCTAVRRMVLLRGRRTLCNYVHAQSTVLVDRVPVEVASQLVTTTKPVGLLLAEARVETAREILAAGSEPAGDRAEYFDVGRDEPMLWRTYRILVGRQPALLITERFPASWFQGPERPDRAGVTVPERPDRAGVTGPERPDRAGVTGPERPDRAGVTGPERPDSAGVTGPERPDRAGVTVPTVSAGGGQARHVGRK